MACNKKTINVPVYEGDILNTFEYSNNLGTSSEEEDELQVTA